jgi:signal transduction histidine kinase
MQNKETKNVENFIIGRVFFLAFAFLLGGALICEFINADTRHMYEYTRNYQILRNLTRPLAFFCEFGALGILFATRKKSYLKEAKEFFSDFFPKRFFGILIHFAANVVVSFILAYFLQDWLGYLRRGDITIRGFNPFSVFFMSWDGLVMYFRPAFLTFAAAAAVISWISMLRNFFAAFRRPRKKRKGFSTFKYVGALEKPWVKVKFYITAAVFSFAFAAIAGTFTALVGGAFRYDEPELLVLLIALGVPLLIFWNHYYSVIGAYARLVYYINEIYEKGEGLENPDENPLAKTSLEKLYSLKNVFNESAVRSVKSERMKTELITNVSHDLKTPLTSIINYVDLLKREGLSSNNAPDYLDVLEQKSNRLKALIEDLFEASKLQSGNAELERSRVNVVDLLKQAVGELKEHFIERGIDLRISYPGEEIYLDLDGKKIWRAFENVLTNIIKYSKTGTRAYISVEKTERVAITFRNISEYEIKFDPEELFERFKRADESRSEDGSGLGLSIAEGVVKLHGGEMDIVVDGDLFKVIIVL